ncbi:unnamed protein product [Lactuca virosa]|uniref:Uncharacterized protein n=1 Tax=Lactuca virosa TaxID=75947 RepID=A0AAU9PAA3_9ASTR|nr:unnamed protein product [Lactuca virosa]
MISNLLKEETVPPGYDPEQDVVNKPKSKSAKTNERKKEKRLQGKNKVSSTGDEEQALESIESSASHINEITISGKPCVATTTPSNSLESPCFLHQTQTDEETDEIGEFESNCRNIEKRQASKEDFPSAPPFSGSFGEIKQEKEHSPLPKANYMSSTTDSVDFLAKSTVEKKTLVVDLKAINKQETSNPSRNVGVKTSSHITLSGKEIAANWQEKCIYLGIMSTILGAGSFVVHSLSAFLNSFLQNFGISQEVQNPSTKDTPLAMAAVGSCLGVYYMITNIRNNFVSPKVAYETATALQLDDKGVKIRLISIFCELFHLGVNSHLHSFDLQLGVSAFDLKFLILSEEATIKIMFNAF